MHLLLRFLRPAAVLGLCVGTAVLMLAGCGPPPPRAAADVVADWRDGVVSRPIDLEFLYVFENTRDAPYFPIEGIAGVAWAEDGALFFCDEVSGRVHAWSRRHDEWFELDRPHNGSFRPLDLAVDGFSLLVLDYGESLLLRYDLRGVFQDQLVSFRHVDPGFERRPSAFAVDDDGRMIFTDVREQQVFLLDAMLEVSQAVGEAGRHREQFTDPSGVAFLRDGGFVVSDRGNRRLQFFNRLGYYESEFGGDFDRDQDLYAPQGVDTDADGNVYMVDPPAGKIHVLGPAGRKLFSVGSELGILAAPEVPVDVAVGPDDQLAVTDRGRQAVIVYRIIYD